MVRCTLCGGRRTNIGELTRNETGVRREIPMLGIPQPRANSSSSPVLGTSRITAISSMGGKNTERTR